MHQEQPKIPHKRKIIDTPSSHAPFLVAHTPPLAPNHTSEQDPASSSYNTSIIPPTKPPSTSLTNPSAPEMESSPAATPAAPQHPNNSSIQKMNFFSIILSTTPHHPHPPTPSTPPLMTPPSQQKAPHPRMMTPPPLPKTPLPTPMTITIILPIYPAKFQPANRSPNENLTTTFLPPSTLSTTHNNQRPSTHPLPLALPSSSPMHTLDPTLAPRPQLHHQLLWPSTARLPLYLAPTPQPKPT